MKKVVRISNPEALKGIKKYLEDKALIREKMVDRKSTSS